MRKVLWFIVSGLMVLSLVVTACGQQAAPAPPTTPPVSTTPATPPVPPTPTTPLAPSAPVAVKPQQEAVKTTAEVPKYGGAISLALGADPTWDLLSLGKAAPHQLSQNRLWDGDWAKGPAGGYGTNDVLWDESTNVFQFKAGHLAESWRFEVNNEKKTVTTIVTVRQGIRFSFDAKSEASRLVNGRELTADDIVWNLNLYNNNPASMNYRFFPNIMGIQATKTGPWEVSITHPTSEHLSNILRLFDNYLIFPPELWDRYKTDASTWRNSVGTGPFMITDYIPGSAAQLVRNPNYWMKDPVGPGKGNQLPYLDAVRFLIIPDSSTRQAALRTGKIDQMAGITLEDKNTMTKQRPDLKQAPRGSAYISPIYMRADLSPFKDVRVRRAMMVATDFDSINKSLYEGFGNILSWPYYYTPAYADLYLGLDDPQMPESVKELYKYNPDKARQLLKEAGYPTGFKTELVLTNPEVDYYAIVKDMWSKVGIDVSFKIIEASARVSIATNRAYNGLIVLGVSPPSTYPEQAQYTGQTWINGSLVDEPNINEMADKARLLALTDFRAAMATTKELMKHLLDQAYAIPTPRYPAYNLWWPWLKNYSGETTVGYFPGSSWVQWVWVDRELKKSMGY